MAKRIPTRLSGQPMTVIVSVRVRDVWAVRTVDAKGKKAPLKDVTLARWTVYGVTAREAFDVLDEAARKLYELASAHGLRTPEKQRMTTWPRLPVWAADEVAMEIEKLGRIEKGEQTK